MNLFVTCPYDLSSLLQEERTSHFAIPGRLSLEAQQQELRLAQEALKRLG
jgi:hypothetical protein